MLNKDLSVKCGFLIEKLLDVKLSDKPALIRLPLAWLQTLYALIRDLPDSQISLRAMSLVYTTLITLVPLLALSFSVLKGFGVHNQIEPMLLNMLEGLGKAQSQEITTRIVSFVNNIKVGVLGVVGLALLIHLVISLMQKIESAFNFIWRVARARSFAERVGDYLTALFVGPLLIFLSTGLTATARHTEIVGHLEKISILGPVFDVVTVVIPWLILAVGFSALYIYMPNTKVKFKAAFIGGLSAAVLWKILGFVFAFFIAQSGSNVAIYAAFATLITFMIWIYLSWFVILLGASVAFYVQNPHYIKISRAPFVLSSRMRTLIGLDCIHHIGTAFYKQTKAPSSEMLTHALNMPILAVQHVLDILEKGGVVTRGGDDEVGYYPGRPFEQTPVTTLLDVLNFGCETDILCQKKLKQSAFSEDVFDALAQSQEKALSTKTIFDMLR